MSMPPRRPTAPSRWFLRRFRGESVRLVEGVVETIRLEGLPQGSAVAYLSSGQGRVLSSLGVSATGFARVRFSR